jgi:predicted nucleic acid-binding Zn ribbon protein
VKHNLGVNPVFWTAERDKSDSHCFCVPCSGPGVPGTQDCGSKKTACIIITHKVNNVKKNFMQALLVILAIIQEI